MTIWRKQKYEWFVYHESISQYPQYLINAIKDTAWGSWLLFLFVLVSSKLCEDPSSWKSSRNVVHEDGHTRMWAVSELTMVSKCKSPRYQLDFLPTFISIRISELALFSLFMNWHLSYQYSIFKWLMQMHERKRASKHCQLTILPAQELPATVGKKTNSTACWWDQVE